MEGLSWEEKYLRLRDDHTSLTHKSNEQDDTIRQMNTKLSQIEKNLKLKYRFDNDGSARASAGASMAGGGGDGSQFGQPRNRENERLVDELHRYNSVLLRENGNLKTKIKSLMEALSTKRKELMTAKLARTRALGAPPPGPRSPCPAARAAGMRSRHVQLAKKRSADDMDLAASTPKQDITARKLGELVDKLRERVSNAETQLQGVRAENQRLRQDKIDAGRDPENAHEQAMMAAAVARREHPGGQDHEEIEKLHRELREAQAKAQLIQARFDHLEARTLAQADLHEGSVDKLQESNRQLRDVRRELQDVLHERDVAVARSARVDDLEETVSELRRQNKELEDQVTKLCESPFISQAFREQERSERVLELEQEGRAARFKIDHLQETAQAHHAALVTLQKQTVRLREDKGRAERALQEMRVRHNETQAGAQVMADKMTLYAGDDDIDLEELERALTIVRRKMTDPTSFPGFLENPEDEEMNNIPALRRKLQRVQVSNLNLTRELERAERMLKAQMSINRDLHVELEEACRRSTLDRGELHQKLRDFEALALERLTRIHRLEAQVKQLLYGPARRQRLGIDANLSAAALEQEQETALLSELAEGDFSADENIVEVWVVGAELEPGALSAGAASFVVVDFFDFESQATPLLPGLSPAFDFATTFKVTVDDFFLRYLGTEGLVLELNQARAADFELIGRRRIPLAGLLSSKPRVILQREPLLSTRDGTFVGYVHVEVRMALPVTELYALFLERRPEEKARVEQARLKDAKAHGYLTSDNAGGARGRGGGVTNYNVAAGGAVDADRVIFGDAGRLRNELEVVIVGCRGLPARGGGPGYGDVAPAAYAHYQLLGFQDVFTPVVHGTRAPVFRHATSFPVATDEKLLRFLARHRLTVTIMDDLANDDTAGAGDSEGGNDDESEGLIGEAMVDLSPLADGRQVIAQWITVEDATGRVAGQVSVSARWVMPLRTGGDPGPHGLSAEEVEGLMARFSPEKDGQVNYVAFLQESDPPPAVLAALRQTHAFLAEAAQKDGLCATEALAAVLGLEGRDRDNPDGRVSEETFVSALLSSGRVNASPDELAALFAFAASCGEGGGTSDRSRGVTLTHLAVFAADGGPLAVDVAGGMDASNSNTSANNNTNNNDFTSWAGWIGAGTTQRGGTAATGAAARRALIKARVKCRDAGLLGRSFPGEAFVRLDPDGAGRVSRLAFKQALREMGFALVDESPPDKESGGRPKGLEWENLTQHRQQVGSAVGGGGGTAGGDLLGSLVEDMGTGGGEILLRKAEGENQEEEARRREFRGKVEEIARVAAEKINAAAALVARNDPSSTTAPLDHPLHEQSGYNGVEPRVAKLDNDIINDDRQNGLAGTADAANIGCVQHSTLHEQGHHPSFAISRDSGARGPSSLGPDGAATLLQSRFRGYRSRRLVANDCAGIRGGAGARKGDGDADHDLALAQKGYAVGGAEGREERSVLDLEDAIDAAFERFEGARPPPNVLAACVKLDKALTGILDRPKFALAIRGLRPSLELSPTVLRAAMDFFQTDSGRHGGAGSIAYRSFAIFCEERRRPDVSPAVNMLRTIILQPGSLDIFARRDPLGNGSVSRVDLFDGLRELGVSGTPPAQLRHLATMFEVAEDMVDYASLVAFASEQPIALRAASVVTRLCGHLLALRDRRGTDLRVALEGFAVVGRERGGVLRLQQLTAALKEMGFTCSDEEMSLLYKRLDPTGGDAGVSCHDLVSFVVESPNERSHSYLRNEHKQFDMSQTAILAGEGTEGRLLRRAQATVVEAAQRMDSDFDAFDKPYLRYDWKRTGRVGTAEFVRATVRCGFPFTRAQAASLAGLFGDGQTVSYPKFLSWATPGRDGLAASGRSAGIAHLPLGPDRGRLAEVGGTAMRGSTEEEVFEEDEAELKVRTALHKMGEDGASRAWEAFERFDPCRNRGAVRQEDLVEVLATLGLPVSSRDVAGLMRRFSIAGTGERRDSSYFSYPGLLQTVSEGSSRRPYAGRPQDVLRQITEELRRLVRQANTDNSCGSALGDRAAVQRPAALRVFESFDRDGNGHVSRRVFRRALEDLGFDLLGDEDTGAEVLDHFDPDRDGRIQYRDFLRVVQAGEGGRARRDSNDDTSHDREGGNASGRATTERERLAATLHRAVARGFDYRREMELEEGTLSAGRRGGEDGVISCQSFRAALRALRADLSESELKELEKRFVAPSAVSGKGLMMPARERGFSGDGGVRYVELLRWGALGGGDGTRKLSQEAWEAGERLRQMIRRRFDVWMPGALKKAFRHFDARRKGKLTEADLSDGLRRLGLELTTRQEQALFSAMDLDGKGCLAYPDLVVFARDPNHADVRDKIKRQLDRVTESHARAELERRDPSASGVVSEQALGKALTRLGADLAGADLSRLMHRFDVHEDGTASIERVISFLLDGGGSGLTSSSDGQKGGKDERPHGGGCRNDKEEGRGRNRQSSNHHDRGRDRGKGGGETSPPITNRAQRSSNKGVTFRDNDDENTDVDVSLSHSSTAAALRKRLRGLIADTATSCDDRISRPPSPGAGSGAAALSIVGPELRDKVRRTLHRASEAQGGMVRGRRGSVDRETVRRAMKACGALLEGEHLRELERRFDRTGSGNIDVEALVDFVAGEVEKDIWQQLASELGKDMGHVIGGRRSSADKRSEGRGGGGDASFRVFIADLSRVADSREEISRRDLRKAIERRCCSAIGESELLVLCDSLDPDRRGRVRLSEVEALLRRNGRDRGTAARGRESDDDSSAEVAAEAAAASLDDLRQLVHAAERERGICLLESFEHFDRRGQGEVSEVEFWEGLQTLGLGRDLPRWHASLIVEPFQGARPGYVRYRDFVKAMGDFHSPRGRRASENGRRGSNNADNRRTGDGRGGGKERRASADDIERLVDRLQEEIGRLTEEEDGPPPFRRVFKAADQRGTGTLPPLAFRRCLLDGLGFDLTEAECETLLEYLDTGGDNNISYREFLQFVGHEVRERTLPRSHGDGSPSRKCSSPFRVKLQEP